MNKDVDAEVIFINKILKYSEMIFNQVTHLLQAMVASAPIAMFQSCGSRCDLFIQRSEMIKIIFTRVASLLLLLASLPIK
jgi:hypothetical protein